MSFNDIFKSSFLESITEFSLLDTLIGLFFALVVGLFIFLIYQKTLTGVMYSSGLALTMVGMTMVTTLCIPSTALSALTKFVDASFNFTSTDSSMLSRVTVFAFTLLRHPD